MRKVLLILLLISLPGCQPGKESPARSTALREVKRLIDQDSFPAKYIIMYEEPSNDIGSIYKITPANSPFVEWSLERPEKVIKYKDRYICLMNPMESIDMPKEKLIEITDYPNDTTTGPVYDEIWYIGVSKNGKKHTLVSTYRSYLTYRYYSFPQLLEYTFEDYDSTHLPRFILASYLLVVDSSYIPKGALFNHIQRIDGEIYYTNVLDEYFKENKDSIRKDFFAVLNGKDTLKLNVVDTITQHLFFESANNAAFFRSLTKEPWDKLYDLLRDSTFYFCAEKGTHVRHSVPYSDYYWLFSIHDNCSYKYVDELYRRGIKQSLKDLYGSYEEWDAN
ncbi:Imm65 family immunity protein [Bacteroides cellulosilyticus]|uniref:Imm65 family immunity protein n=1 Tax=Bacteroides cellulosilyticus TaxID=246787 RepID=UPI003219188A